jgi:hypothetical protein
MMTTGAREVFPFSDNIRTSAFAALAARFLIRPGGDFQ